MKSLCAIPLAIAVSGSALAVASPVREIVEMSDATFVREAQRRVWNGLTGTDAGLREPSRFRNLRLLKWEDGGRSTRRVCGEVLEEGEDNWQKFYANLDDHRPEVEPHAGLSSEAVEHLGGLCSSVIAKLRGGEPISDPQQRICEASLELRKALWERARFNFLWESSCSKDFYRSTPYPDSIYNPEE